MFELLMLLLFGWLFVLALRLIFKVAWGLTKIVAFLLIIAAFPVFLGILLVAGGLALLLPVALVAVAILLLKMFI